MRKPTDFHRCLEKAQNVIDGLEDQLRRRKEEVEKLQRDSRALSDRVTELSNRTMNEQDIESMGYMKLPVGGDGKPIRPGETVFGPLKEELTVEGVSEGPWVVTSYYTQLALEKAVNLTHENPMRFPLDADGTECKMLDKVWLNRPQGLPYEIVGIMDDLEHIRVRREDGHESTLPAVEFTHTEPDSWEKLDRDAENLRQIIGFHLGDYEFEEGSGREGRSVQTELLDMIRRAKSLAGVEGGDAE